MTALADDPNADETIDADACAQLLHCSVEKVEDLAVSGELPAVKFGRGWIFVRPDLLTYLAQRAREEAAVRRSKRNAPTTLLQVLTPAPKSRRRALPVLPDLAPRP